MDIVVLLFPINLSLPIEKIILIHTIDRLLSSDLCLPKEWKQTHLSKSYTGHHEVVLLFSFFQKNSMFQRGVFPLLWILE